MRWPPATRPPLIAAPVSAQVTEGDGDDTDLQIFCVSCSHPVNPKVALRHMERCYAKVRLAGAATLRRLGARVLTLTLTLGLLCAPQYESQTSFGSMYPTRIEG